MLRLKAIVFLALSMPLISCIQTYRGFPEMKVGKPPEAKPYGTLYYRIKPLPYPPTEYYTPDYKPTLNDMGVLSSGEKALYAVFRDKSSFKNTVEINHIPETGVFCEIEIKGRRPSGNLLREIFDGIASMDYGLLLHIIPTWSSDGGYWVTYDLYINGKKEKTSEYFIARKQVVWLGAIPFLWVNFFTYSTADALEATAYQFFEDAAPLFSKAQLISG